MSTYKHLNTINNSKKKLFLTKDIQNLLEIDSKRTLEDLIKRLISEGILIPLERGKYKLESAQITDFDIAQFLYSPSYISFETALNYHGILSQFPMEITSTTTKSTVKKTVQGKIYTYSKLSTNLFTGYLREGDSLIALPEKSLFDQLYMISKGIKTKQYLDEMDYSVIQKSKLRNYFKLVSPDLANSINDLMNTYL